MNPELEKILNNTKRGVKTLPVCPVCRGKVHRVMIKGVDKTICDCGKLKPNRQRS